MCDLIINNEVIFDSILSHFASASFHGVFSKSVFRSHLQTEQQCQLRHPTLSLLWTQGLASLWPQFAFLLCLIHENVYLVLEPQSIFQFSLSCSIHHCWVLSKENHSAVNLQHQIALEDLRQYCLQYFSLYVHFFKNCELRSIDIFMWFFPFGFTVRKVLPIQREKHDLIISSYGFFLLYV